MKDKTKKFFKAAGLTLRNCFDPSYKSSIVQEPESEKIVTTRTLGRIRASLSDKKFIVTNGCFDVIHAGHVKFLKEAKEMI